MTIANSHSAIKRLLAKRRIEGECWIYTGSTTDDGYGQFWFRGANCRVHRVAYYIWNGDLVPGMNVDHTCFNILCFNPDHLEQVTIQENLDRSISRRYDIGRFQRSKQRCPKGHPYGKGNTYRTPEGDRECRTCRRHRQAAIRSSRRRVTK